MKKAMRLLVVLALLMAMTIPSVLACTEFCGQDFEEYDSERIPDADELHICAYRQGDNMIGKTARIVRSGNVREQPGTQSRILYEAFNGDRLYILDYHVLSRNPLAVWIKVDFYGQEGWISAHMAEIISRPADAYDVGGDPLEEAYQARYVGARVIIKIRSGRARDAAGEDGVVIKYVHEGEVYKVHDCALDSKGNPWLQIHSGSGYSWISAGLAEMLE